MSFDNNSFYDDNSTKNWQPQPTPMEDRRRRHTGKWITVIVIVGMLALVLQFARRTARLPVLVAAAVVVAAVVGLCFCSPA